MRGIEICVPARSLRNTAYCACSQHAHMWTISSLARIFPYATTNAFVVATASATSFLSSAVMYLWGQLSYIRRYCRRVFRVVVSHFGSLLAEVNLVPRWREAWGENKKDPYFYIQVTERNTKKRTALVRLKM